ncbi:MAG TPA: hypothetical protein VHZ24_06640 [Pirellulales bacterium]|jgi:hypothetical protein|nr:hypothetical protein [Pirellulales bacterium]
MESASELIFYYEAAGLDTLLPFCGIVVLIGASLLFAAWIVYRRKRRGSLS